MKFEKALPDIDLIVGSGPHVCYVYALRFRKPGHQHDGRIRYVGKALDPWRRFWRHMNARDNYGRVKRSVAKNGKAAFSLELLAAARADVVEKAEELALQWEINLIRHYDTAKGKHGLNLTLGGEGASLVGEARKRKRVISRRVMREIKKRPEVQAKYRELALARHADPEFAERFSLMIKWRMNDPTARENHLAAMKRLHADPEFARARDERLARLKELPEFWEANHAAIRKFTSDPAYKAGCAERATAYYADPENREARREEALRLHADTDFAARYRDGLKRRYSDPANVESHARKTRARHENPAFSRSAKMGIALRWATKHAADGKPEAAQRQIHNLKSLLSECGDDPGEARMKAAAEEFLATLGALA